MINHKEKFIYVHIPKTGGHSIDKYFMSRNLVDDKLWHCTARQLHDHLGADKWSEYTSFTVVRNPWDRMVSEFCWQSGTGDKQIATPWGNKTATFKEFLLMVKDSPTDHHNLNQVCQFDTWYRRQEVKDGHLNTQASFVLSPSGEKLVQHIIRLEQLSEEFLQILSKLNLPIEPLPHLNKSSRTKYQDYYDQESIDIVATRFKDDIELFNYNY